MMPLSFVLKQSVYTRQTSGLVMYKCDPLVTRSEHRSKINLTTVVFGTSYVGNVSVGYDALVDFRYIHYY